MKSKIYLFILLIVTSCTSETKNIIGIWEVTSVSTNNPLSIADNFILDDIFMYNFNKIEFKNDSILVLTSMFKNNSHQMNYKLEEDIVTIDNSKLILGDVNPINFFIINSTQDKLVLGQANDSVINFSNIEFKRID